MASKNMALLIGRVGKDPEVRHLPNGNAVANFSLATSERWKDKATDEWKENIQWHRVTVYRGAENVGKYVQKGSMVMVTGKITYREWDDKEGNKRSLTEIVADDVQFLDAKPSGDSGGRKPEQPPQQKPKAKNDVPDDSDGDDIPF